MINLINAPLDGPMCTMEDIVAQFIDRSPQIYREFISGDNANGYYMRPEEMSYCPTWYQITHSKLSGLSVTLYKEVEYEGEEFNSPIKEYKNGITYRFNGRTGQFPELRGVNNPSMYYKNNSLVRLCDIDAVYVNKKITIVFNKITLKDIDTKDSDKKKSYEEDYFLTSNIRFKNVIKQTDSVKLEYEMFDKSYFYFAIKNASDFNSSDEYKNYTIRVVINRTNIINQEFNIGQTYVVKGVDNDVMIYIEGTKKDLHVLQINQFGSGAGLLDVMKLSSNWQQYMTLMTYPDVNSSVSLSYSDYSDNSKIFFYLIVNVHDSNHPVKNYRHRLVGYKDMNVFDEYVIEDWSTPFEFGNRTNDTIRYENIDISDYKSIECQLEVESQYVNKTIYITTDQVFHDAYRYIRLFGTDAVCLPMAGVSKVRWKYTYTEENENYFNTYKKIPWEIQINLSSEAFAETRNVITGIKMYESHSVMMTVPENILNANHIATGEYSTATITNGKNINIIACDNLISVTVSRSSSDIIVNNMYKDEYIFADDVINEVSDSTIRDYKDSMKYRVYVPIDEFGDIHDYDTISYTFSKYTNNQTDQSVIKTEKRKLYGEGSDVLGHTNAIPGIVFKHKLYAIWPEIYIDNIQQIAGTSYKLHFELNDSFVSKKVVVKVPTFALSYPVISIVNDKFYYYNNGITNINFSKTVEGLYTVYTYNINASRETIKSFYATVDFMSDTPNFLKSVKLSVKEKVGETLHTSVSEELYDTNELYKYEFNFSYRPDATEVEFTFDAERNDKQFPIIVVNQSADVDIYNDEDNELIVSGVRNYSATNPLIVMTSAKNSGKYKFKLVSTNGSNNIVYSFTLAAQNKETLYLTDGEGFVEIIGHTTAELPRYFVVCGNNTTKTLFIELKDAKNNSITIQKFNGSSWDAYIGASLVGNGIVNYATNGVDAYLSIPNWSVGDNISLSSVINGSTPHKVVYSLSYSEEYKPYTDEDGWITVNGNLTEDTIIYYMGYDLKKENLLQGANTLKLTISVSALMFYGFVKTYLSNALGTLLLHIPTARNSVYYAVIGTTNTGVKPENISMVQKFLPRVSDPVYEKTISAGHIRYFVYKITNLQDITGPDHYTHEKVDLCLMNDNSYGSVTFSGTLDRCLKLEFSDLGNEQVSIEGLPVINELYIPATQDSMHPVLGPWDHSLYVLIKSFAEYTEDGRLEYITNFDSARFKVMFNNQDGTQTDATDEFDIEPFYFYKDLSYTNADFNGFVRIRFSEKTHDLVESDIKMTYMLVMEYNSFVAEQIMYFHYSNKRYHWYLINTNVLKAPQFVGLTDSDDVIGKSGIAPGSIVQSKQGVSPYFYKNEASSDVIPAAIALDNISALVIAAPLNNDDFKVMFEYVNGTYTTSKIYHLAKNIVLSTTTNQITPTCTWDKYIQKNGYESTDPNGIIHTTHSYHLIGNGLGYYDSDTYLFHTCGGNISTIEMTVVYEFYYNINRVFQYSHVTIRDMKMQDKFKIKSDIPCTVTLKNLDGTVEWTLKRLSDGSSSWVGCNGSHKYKSLNMHNHGHDIPAYETELTYEFGPTTKKTDFKELRDFIEYCYDEPLLLNNDVSFDKEYSINVFYSHAFDAFTKGNVNMNTPRDIHIIMNRIEIRRSV